MAAKTDLQRLHEAAQSSMIRHGYKFPAIKDIQFTDIDMEHTPTGPIWHMALSAAIYTTGNESKDNPLQYKDITLSHSGRSKKVIKQELAKWMLALIRERQAAEDKVVRERVSKGQFNPVPNYFGAPRRVSMTAGGKMCRDLRTMLDHGNIDVREHLEYMKEYFDMNVL
ncbi:uncharacterized protein RAG0_11888 [Rhynchosporium agropyri]|uniref:Uncharacterized protein n=1 Tax=Rhynchosporium agropyri TaxID=914238 RepID=A0A1E1L6A8_9HELO|nr:uncharacterized protein RAG0_11888 [Rhynchosporium agropyri]